MSQCHCLETVLDPSHDEASASQDEAVSENTIYFREFITKHTTTRMAMTGIILSLYMVPLAFGPSGTGKTTLFLCALSLFGGTANRSYSMVTKEKIIDLCRTYGVPLGVDDPQSKVTSAT